METSLKAIGLITLLAAVAAAAGCATNSGVVPMGKGIYTITAQAATGFSGLGDLKANALRQAAAHCNAQGGKDFQLVDVQETKPPYLLGNYPRVDLQFRCVDK